MTSGGSKRRLVAIMSLDVVGYSRLIGEDEAGTLAALRALRNDVVQPELALQGGRPVKWMGDGLIAEFPSVVKAVECAVAIQERIAANGPGAIRLRVGVTLGDVVVEGRDLLGDGVNVAARLQGLAEPGGIAVSGPVREELGGKLAIAFTDGGTQQVKNIARLLHVWRWAPGAAPDLAAVAGVAVKLPDRPSIAVLPFANMSADPDQAFFGDGIAEDIITQLASLRAFLVIARNSTFAYKGRPVDLRDVGRELGVRYVLEGSVRRAGDRIRVTAQLIEAATANHLWAERYDRQLTDIFAIQDEITTGVVSCVGPELLAAEHGRARRKPPQSLDAWECYIEALYLVAQRTQDGTARALELLNRALALDPAYAAAHGLKAWTTVWRGFQGWLEMPRAMAEAEAAIAAARAGGSEDPWAHLGDAMLAQAMHDNARAIAAAERAVAVAPALAIAHAILGSMTACGGRGDAGIPHIDTAVRLSPRDVLADDFFLHYAMAHFQAGRYGEAARFAELAIRERPEHVVPYLFGAASYGLLDDVARGARMVEGIARHAPGLTLERCELISCLARTEDRARIADGLRRAGLA